MARLFHVKADFKATNGQPQDAASMSHSITTPDMITPVDGIATTIIQAFVDVFLNGDIGGFTVAQWLGNSLSRVAGDLSVKVYGPMVAGQMHGAIKGDGSTYLGSPVRTEFRTLGGSSAGPIELPRSTAVDLVLRGFGWETAPVEVADGPDDDDKVDRPRQRVTGRLKIGPLSSSASVQPAGELVSRPAPNLVTTLRNAGNAWRDTLFAAPWGGHLSVWSRANGTMVDVTDVQVPNAFTSAARRKVRPTSRNTLAVD